VAGRASSQNRWRSRNNREPADPGSPGKMTTKQLLEISKSFQTPNLPSQSLSLVLKKLNLIQQIKQHQNKNKIL